MKSAQLLFLLLSLLLIQLLANCSSLPPVNRVFLIVLENHNWSDFKDSPNAPFLNGTLLPMAAHCENYYNPTSTHPSLPNYLWLEAGTNFSILDDEGPEIHHQNTTNHLVSLLDRAGISWKTYQEDISGLEVPLGYTGLYAPRHNPFVYFDDVTGTNDPMFAYGITHIRPYSELAADLQNDTIARYNFITPNLCNDGHNLCGDLSNQVRQSDDWLASEVPKILASGSWKNRGALFITWDEGENGSDGPIGMIMISPMARSDGFASTNYYNHSSLLRTIQEIFGVSPLLNDAANATNLGELFKPLHIPSAHRMPNGDISMTYAGVIPGSTIVVEASRDLLEWTPIHTNQTWSWEFTVADRCSSEVNARFYRVLQLP